MARSPDRDLSDPDDRPTPNRRSEETLPLRPRTGRPSKISEVAGVARTLAWLVPLTLLIWVYAEQQQEYRGTVSGIPVSLQSAVPNRYFEFADGVQQQTVNLTLSGPRDAVDRVSKQLLNPPGLPLEVGSRGAGTNQVNVVAAVQGMPLFRLAGVTVIESVPPEVRVNVDNVIERDATVVVDPHTAPFSGTVTFEPPRVRLRGPRTQMDAVEPGATNGAKLFVYADLSKVDLRQPGEHAPENVPLTFPHGATSDQVRAQPGQVTAKVQVTTAYENGTIIRVPILVKAPPAVWHDFDIQLGDSNDPSISLVHVTGPADKVKLVTGPSPQVQATAELTVGSDDAGQDRQGTLTITNLPEGVKPTPEDAARKQTFKLIPRAANGG